MAADPLDSAINQHLQSLKEGQGMAMLGAPRPGLPPAFAGPPGMGMPLQQPGLPGLAMPGAPGMGPPPPGPDGIMVSVAIDNLAFRYQLAEADLRETFQRWGPIQAVHVVREGIRDVGVLHFSDAIDAADAQRQLHGHSFQMEGSTASLAVVLGGPEVLSGGASMGFPAPMAPGLPGMGGLQPAAPPMLGGLPGAMPGLVPPPAGAMPKSAPTALGLSVLGGKGDGRGAFLGKAGFPMDSWAAEGPPRPAWTCKILLHADVLHPEFPVLSKVVGQNAQNVEHIRSQTNCQVQMRGRGSGHLEPETGAELPEPLFVWLTSDSAAGGKSAVELFQDLLKHVYEEHVTFVKERGRAPPPALEPTVLEGVDVPRAAPAFP